MKSDLAIAYAMKRKAKKMFQGGQMDSGYLAMPEARDPENTDAEDEDEMAYAMGGDVVDRIMSKRQNMSEGGKVANGSMTDDSQAGFKPNEFDDLVLRDDLEGGYTAANSGDEIGNAREDEDRADIVSRIMHQRKMRQTNPRPA